MCDFSLFTAAPRQAATGGKIDLGKAIVRLLSSEDAIARTSPEVACALESKHPPASADAAYPPDPGSMDSNTRPATAEEVLKAVTSFLNGSVSPAFEGHAWCLKRRNSGLHCSCNYPDVRRPCPENGLPCPLRRFTDCAQKTLRRNPTIAVRNPLRRLAGKVVSSRLMEDMGTFHACKTVRLRHPRRCRSRRACRTLFLVRQFDSRVLLKLDFQNAFNTVYYDKILHRFRDAIPQYYSFVSQICRPSSEQ